MNASLLKTTLLSLLIFVVLFSVRVNSFSFEPGWESIRPATQPETDITPLLQQAATLVEVADTREELVDLLNLYRRVLAADPQNREALFGLATYHTLLGTGYTPVKSEKKRTFRNGVKYSERLMVLNPDFKKAVENGIPVWEACVHLSAEDAPAMAEWVTAVLYYYKECTGKLGKIYNVKWMHRAKTVMDHLEKVDADYAGGANYFNQGIYYLTLPGSQGGDMEKAEKLFQKSFERGPKSLLAPWGRAKYYHVNTQNRDGFLKDLQWVVDMDLHEATHHPNPWNVLWQREARDLIKQVDDLF